MKNVEQKSDVRPRKGLTVVVCLTVMVCAALVRAQGGPSEEVLDGDFDRDGRVTMIDLGLLSAHWLTTLPWGPWDSAPPRLVAHYRLDGDATDGADDNDGVPVGTPSWVGGKNAAVGSGAVMLHSGDRIAIAHDPVFDITGPITLAAWVRITAPADTAAIVSKGDTAWQLAVDSDGHLTFSCAGLDGARQITGPTNVADNNWHHVAGVYDRTGAQMTIYIDGVVDASASASGRIAVNDRDVWIGANAETGGQWFNGLIDDVRLYNCALTSQQIFNRTTWHVDAVNGRDTFNGQGKGRAFQTIQKAIDTAADGDEILLWPGVYREVVFFWAKAVTVRSAADAAVIEAPGDYAVNFCFGEQEDSVLQNVIIANSARGIFIESSSPTIRHVTVVNNGYGLVAYTGSRPVISNSIFWNNPQGDIFNDTFDPHVTFSCVQRFVEGEGNISLDPLFAAAASGDYHLASETGRFVPDGEPGNSGAGGGYWVRDEHTSPCIDAADPALNPMGETMPNGARVNMGACGATAQASRSPWPLKGDANHDGTVDAYDLRILAENWLSDNQGS